jgi:DNA-binding PadR family transcriptional regulator
MFHKSMFFHRDPGELPAELHAEWHARGDRLSRHHARFGRHGGPFEWGAARGFGGGRERFLDPGDLQLIILQLLAEKPSYGYELIKSIEERLSGGYAPSPGVVYPTLTLLEEKGLAQVVEPSEGGRKTYTVTDAGRADLAANAGRLREITERLEHTGHAFRRGRSPQLMRAFHNLGEAVRGRMMRGNLTPEQIARIAEAIDTAARTIDSV